ncbi:hypothetical protein LCGC14_2186950 [marine sediment metagenome]|uniref:Uncharacterized protein n=1 Tax=marine sediment metagenome TaxID=412755 RepID=A0A0F9GGH8_9ZZZZ
MINRRNLDPSLLNWLMGITGLGPGLGDVHYLVPVASAYYSWLRDDLKQEPSKIHFNLADGYNALTASRNDVLLTYPGTYLATTEQVWAKANTHLIGMAGPNVLGDHTEPSVVFHTQTANVAATLSVTGGGCQFHNFQLINNASDADNLTAGEIDSYSSYWKNVAFQGHYGATQNSTAVCASLYIMDGAFNPIFDHCTIGQDNWGTRSAANSGVLRFADTTGRPSGGQFLDCLFLSRSVTSTVCMVAVPAAQCIGRSWLFKNCHFSNFYDEVTLLNQVFYTVTGTQKFTMQLKGCSSAGFTEWQTGDFSVVVSDMPITGLGGGQMRQPTASVGS